LGVASVLAPREALFLPHELVWVFGNLLAYSRMLLHILLQRGMLLDKFFVLYQRWVSAQLLGDFRMTVGKTIEARQFPTSRVVVAPVVIPTILASIDALVLPLATIRFLCD